MKGGGGLFYPYFSFDVERSFSIEASIFSAALVLFGLSTNRATLHFGHIEIVPIGDKNHEVVPDLASLIWPPRVRSCNDPRLIFVFFTLDYLLNHNIFIASRLKGKNSSVRRFAPGTPPPLSFPLGGALVPFLAG